MLARRRQSCSTRVTADDTESAPEVPTPTGRDRRSPHTSDRDRVTRRPAATSSESAVAAAKRRVGGQHHRRRTPTSSPDSDTPSHPAVTAEADNRSGAEAPAAVHDKTQLKYKRVKDSVRQQQKRHLTSRKSDARQEGIFD